MRKSVAAVDMKVDLVKKREIFHVIFQKNLYFILKISVFLSFKTEMQAKMIRFLKKHSGLGPTVFQRETDRRVLWELQPLLFPPVLHQSDVGRALPFHTSVKILRQSILISLFNPVLYRDNEKQYLNHVF